MKNNINILKCGLLASVAGLAMVSCESFLDQEPQSSVTEAIYFTAPAHFEYASNKFYDALSFGDYTTDASSDISGNFGDSEPVGRGIITLPETDDVWDNCYTRLRRINQMLTAAETYENPSEITEYVASGSFFRAYEHFTLLQRFGGVPIVTEVLDPSSDVTYGPRNSRYEVISQILADLDVAIAGLLDNDKVSSTGKVTKQAAQSFKARVCLYEATWDKYVGTSTDGDGVTSGAGSTKPSDYPSTTELFTEAKSLALSVMNSGYFELWDQSDNTIYDSAWGSHHLRYLFVLEDALSNPFGLQKSDNKEYIFQSIYDYTYRQTGLNMSHSHVCPATRKLMDMYPCTDGLPIQYSPLFQGYENVLDEYQNRDWRLTSLQAIPGMRYWDNNVTTGRASSLVAGYDIAQEDMPANLTYVPGFVNPLASKRNIGYQGQKWVSEHPERADKAEAMNFPLIRLAEVYLIYAEATCELGGGSISDSDLDLSINKIRARSGIADLTNDLIAPYSDLTMLGEIRRERAIELYGEGFRFDDLKRWDIAVEELATVVCAVYAYYDGKATEYVTLSDGSDEANWDFGGEDYVDLSDADISGFPDGGLVTTETSISSYAGFPTVKPGALIIDSKSVRLFAKKHYLEPLPNDQLQLNTNLTQNPDWI